MAKPKPPRKRPNMVRHSRVMTPEEGVLIQRLLYQGCHDLGMPWRKVAVIFRCHHEVCRLEAAKGFPVDLDPEVATSIVEMMRAGPEATWRLLQEQAKAG